MGVLNTNLVLLLLCFFQRKVCASLSALGEVQLLEAITFPPGECSGHFAQIVCNQINKEDKVQRRKCMPVGHTGYHTNGHFGRNDHEGVPFNNLVCVGRFVIQFFPTTSIFSCHYRVGAGAYEQVVIKR